MAVEVLTGYLARQELQSTLLPDLECKRPSPKIGPLLLLLVGEVEFELAIQ